MIAKSGQILESLRSPEVDGDCSCQWRKEGHAPEAVDLYRGMFEAIMSATLSAIIVMGEDHKIRLVNKAALRLFACDEVDLIGQDVKILMADEKIRSEHDGYVENHLKTGKQAIIGKGGRSVYARRKDGSAFPALLWVDKAVLPNGETVFVGIISDNSEQAALRETIEAQNRTLEYLLMIDALTGISSRRAFEERYPLLISISEREGTPFSVVMFDIDHFKDVNDVLGHDAGDDVLREFWEILRSRIKRPGDMAARYGGEEFVLLLPNTDTAGAKLVAEEIRSTVEAFWFLRGTLKKTASFWIATRDKSHTYFASGLLKAADLALYVAKSQGRNQVRVAE